MKYKHIIWDWNGTLIDDLDMNFDILNILLTKRNIKKAESLDVYLEHFGFPIIDFYKKMGFNLETENFADIAREYARLYDELYPSAEIFSDAVPALRKIKAAGINQIILSQTEQGYLNRQVAYFDLEHLFTDIVGNSNIFAGGKTEIARSYLEKENINCEDVLFVGDTTHDREVAASLGCNCVLISRGHNSRKRLEEAAGNVYSSIDEVLELILK